MAELRIQNMVRNSPTAQPSRGADWREQAACADPWRVDPEWWFSFHPAEQERAKQICAGCPVQTECAALGQGHEHGIWAGKKKQPRRYPTCVGCERKMRPTNGLAADHPGTVARGSKTQCDTCYRHTKRKETRK